MEHLKRIGIVIQTTKSGTILVKSKFTPKEGAWAVDPSLRKVGKIIDIFGPVKAPYVAIKPLDTKDLKNLIGKPLYLLEKKKRGRIKR